MTLGGEDGWMSDGCAMPMGWLLAVGPCAGAAAAWVGYITGAGPVYNLPESLAFGTAAGAVVGALLLGALGSVAYGLQSGNTRLRRSPLSAVWGLALTGAAVGAAAGFIAVLTLGLGFRSWLRWAYYHGGPYPPNLPLWAKVVLGGVLGSAAAGLLSLIRGRG